MHKIRRENVFARLFGQCCRLKWDKFVGKLSFLLTQNHCHLPLQQHIQTEMHCQTLN